jgi:hypothetical protein
MANRFLFSSRTPLVDRLRHHSAPSLDRGLDGPNGFTPCLEWQGRRCPLGYGRLSWKGRDQYAHRLSCELAHGECPDHMETLHECDNRACINSDHLRWGTHAENQADMVRRDRINPRLGSDHHSSTLTNEIVLAIVGDQRRQIDIANQYGIAEAHVSQIKTGKLWGHLTGIPRSTGKLGKDQITEEIAAQIMADPRYYREIAETYNISMGHISKIKNGSRHPYLNGRDQRYRGRRPKS